MQITKMRVSYDSALVTLAFRVAVLEKHHMKGVNYTFIFSHTTKSVFQISYQYHPKIQLLSINRTQYLKARIIPYFKKFTPLLNVV